MAPEQPMAHYEPKGEALRPPGKHSTTSGADSAGGQAHPHRRDAVFCWNECQFHNETWTRMEKSIKSVSSNEHPNWKTQEHKPPRGHVVPALVLPHRRHAQPYLLTEVLP